MSAEWSIDTLVTTSLKTKGHRFCVEIELDPNLPAEEAIDLARAKIRSLLSDVAQMHGAVLSLEERRKAKPFV